MTHDFVEISRTESDSTTRIIIEDHGRHPSVCRQGLWVGRRREFVERVELSINPPTWQSPPPPWIGWRVDGKLLYGLRPVPWTTPTPVLGYPTVTFQVPSMGRLTLTSSKGVDQQCFTMQVVWSRFNPPQFPPEPGSAKELCITGAQVRWPTFRLHDEDECLKSVRDFLDRHEFIPPDRPGPPPVERALSRLRGDDAVRVRAYLETLDRLDRNSDAELFEDISAELRALVEWAGGPVSAPGASERAQAET